MNKYSEVSKKLSSSNSHVNSSDKPKQLGGVQRRNSESLTSSDSDAQDISSPEYEDQVVDLSFRKSRGFKCFKNIISSKIISLNHMNTIQDGTHSSPPFKSSSLSISPSTSGKNIDFSLHTETTNNNTINATE